LPIPFYRSELFRTDTRVGDGERIARGVDDLVVTGPGPITAGGSPRLRPPRRRSRPCRSAPSYTTNGASTPWGAVAEDGHPTLVGLLFVGDTARAPHGGRPGGRTGGCPGDRANTRFSGLQLERQYGELLDDLLDALALDLDMMHVVTEGGSSTSSTCPVRALWEIVSSVLVHRQPGREPRTLSRSASRCPTPMVVVITVGGFVQGRPGQPPMTLARKGRHSVSR
jgi:hypothetical protein